MVAPRACCVGGSPVLRFHRPLVARCRSKKKKDTLCQPLGLRRRVQAAQPASAQMAVPQAQL